MTRFGLSAALVTPYDESGEINLEASIEQARRCLQDGCSSVTLFGTTGEGASIGSTERERILKGLLEAGIPPSQIVMGVLVDAAEDAAAQARFALALGIKGILLAPPCYFKGVSDEGLFDWFSAAFARLGRHARDVILYNIPSVTMVSLSLALIDRLKRSYPGVVVGVKDSSGDWSYTERLLRAHNELLILIGDERHLARGVRMGGQGAISGMANFATREVKQMAEEGTDNPRVEEFVLQLLKYPVTPAVKAVVAHVTGQAAWASVRPPLDIISTDGRHQLGLAFDALFPTHAA